MFQAGVSGSWWFQIAVSRFCLKDLGSAVSPVPVAQIRSSARLRRRPACQKLRWLRRSGAKQTAGQRLKGIPSLEKPHTALKPRTLCWSREPKRRGPVTPKLPFKQSNCNNAGGVKGGGGPGHDRECESSIPQSLCLSIHIL